MVYVWYCVDCPGEPEWSTEDRPEARRHEAQGCTLIKSHRPDRRVASPQPEQPAADQPPALF